MRGTLLQQSPVAVARFYSSGVESTPASTLQEMSPKGKEPPRVSLLELIYRLTFQGFRNRMHELQVRLRLIFIYLAGLCNKKCTNAFIGIQILLFKQCFLDFPEISKFTY